MDISFKTADGRFNFRVCAMIIRDGKILAMHDDRSPYFYLPGGRVALGETVEDAVIREAREELGIDVKLVRPLWLNQAFFVEDVDNEKFHELCVYFLVDASETELYSRGERFEFSERGRLHRFEWLEFSRLKDEYFYPNFLKTEIFKLPEVFTIRTELE